MLLRVRSLNAGKMSPASGGIFSGAPPPDQAESVTAWIRGGGGARLEQLVDLLTIEPFPETAAGGVP